MTEAEARLTWIEECADGDMAFRQLSGHFIFQRKRSSQIGFGIKPCIFCLFKIERDLSVFKC